MSEQPKIINVNVGPDGAAKLDKLAERFKVSRVIALRWILASVDPASFLPVSFLDTTIVPETQEQVAA